MVGILVWIVVVGLFAVGLTGTLVPGIPGLSLVWLGIALYAWASGFTVVSLTTVIILGVACAAVLLGSYLGGAWLARASGGKKWASLGALVGGILGAIWGNVLGLILGGFLGSLLGAWWETRQAPHALKVALFSTLGFLLGTVAQFFLALFVIAGFFLTLIFT